MIKNYPAIIFQILLAIGFFITHDTVFAQEPKVFTLNDFDLNGTVKSCIVITDYGKEEYDFERNGFLTKLVTRYNDMDYDVTYYRYQNTNILEKRVENYRDGVFDKNTSIANFYEIDTTASKKITEKIVSYNKEFLEQYIYVYDNEDRLVEIHRTNNDGVDETKIEYVDLKGETTKTYILNEVIEKSTRSSTKMKKNGSVQRIVLTKEFLNGDPNKALEQVYDSNDKLMSEIRFIYDTRKKQFTPQVTVAYSYDESGMLLEVKTKAKNRVVKKSYIYQYDGGEYGNWIKEIIIPENSYTTRKITYYEPEVIEEE